MKKKTMFTVCAFALLARAHITQPMSQEEGAWITKLQLTSSDDELREAALTGNTEVIPRLLEPTEGRMLCIPTAEGRTILVQAPGARADAPDDYGRTPLRLAILGNKIESARLLLEHGSNIEAQDREGRTPLSFAVDLGREEIVSFLLGRNANIEAQDRKGRTPLHIAAAHGHDMVLIALVNQGANKEARDNEGYTPLHLAATHNHVLSVELLVDEFGADIEAQDNKGRTPLQIVGEEDYRSRQRLRLPDRLRQRVPDRSMLIRETLSASGAEIQESPTAELDW